MSDVTQILDAIEQGDGQAAEMRGISLATAKRYWAYARAWLYRELMSNQD
jgi:hypothetical protein